MSEKNKVDPKIAEIVSNFKVSSLEEMNNIVNQLKKAFIENALNEEMTEHLGYEKWDQNSRAKSSNYRNGYSKKSVKTNNGLLELSIPRDEESLFEPKIVKKYQNDISGFDEKIILMYVKGMSTRDINEYFMIFMELKFQKILFQKLLTNYFTLPRNSLVNCVSSLLFCNN